MNLTEKVAYLKGLVEGLDINEDKKQGKIIMAMLDLLEDMALTISDNEDEMAELTAQVDEIDEDLALLEDEFYDDEECDCDDDECDCDCDDEDEEEDFYEVECPNCNETIYLDDDLLDDDYIVCPNCGEEIEIEFDDECDCDCDCEDCAEEAEDKE
jgi:hypothetical protein